LILSSCQKAHNILKTDADIKQRWSQAVRWLHEQLEVRNILLSSFVKHELKGLLKY
jgi:hypothetical protein